MKNKKINKRPLCHRVVKQYQPLVDLNFLSHIFFFLFSFFFDDLFDSDASIAKTYIHNNLDRTEEEEKREKSFRNNYR